MTLRCIDCGQPTNVLYTRTKTVRGKPIIHRRRECPLGHRATSVENWLSRDLRKARFLGTPLGTSA